MLIETKHPVSCNKETIMKITINAPKGQRTLKQFHWIHIEERAKDTHIWYQYSNDKWVYHGDEDYDKDSSHCNHHSIGDKHFPKSYKAFIRYLKKHPELIGCKVVLYSRYEGHFITVQM